MKHLDYPPLKLLDISAPTRKAMCSLGISSLPDIAELKPDELRYLDHREQVLRELLRLCVLWYVRPEWVKSVTIDLHEQARAPKGYERVTQPFAPGERWMIEMAIALLNGKPWCVVRGEQGTMTLWRGDGHQSSYPHRD